jgi:hypothetical protein
MNNNIEPMPTQNPWAWVHLGMGMGMGTQCRALMTSVLMKRIIAHDNSYACSGLIRL